MFTHRRFVSYNTIPYMGIASGSVDPLDLHRVGQCPLFFRGFFLPCTAFTPFTFARILILSIGIDTTSIWDYRAYDIHPHCTLLCTLGGFKQPH